MGQTTLIPWLGGGGSTWNPLTGCEHVSPGCDHCYAERMASRFPKTFGPVTTDGKWNGKVETHWDRRYLPKDWKRPRRIFVGSMSDLFYSDDYGDIEGVLNVMRETQRHTYFVLTKHMENAEYTLIRAKQGCAFANGIGWPFPHVWIGVSAEDQNYYDFRVEKLVGAIPARHRFVSLEPLLGPVRLDARHLKDRGGLEWVITGGENGPGARPMDLDWARSLRDQCGEAGIPFFYKGGGAGKDDVLDGVQHHQIPEVS
jgi:protein gp37